MFRHAFARALEHDCLNLAQSAAYSAMVALFPALIVIAATIAQLPDVTPLKIEVGEFFDQVLPANVFPLLTSYFGGSASNQPHSMRALVVAGFVSFVGASSVIATLMEGMHRAAGLPFRCWTFVQKRTRALILVPLSLVPLAVASLLVVFGRWITEMVAFHLATVVQPAFFGVALAIRWTISLTGVVGLTALIYHFGTPREHFGTPREHFGTPREHLGAPAAAADPMSRRWVATLPGAVVATAMWFITTLAFGWYVTSVANYSAVYGSLGAGIALLFWLYIVFLSVLCGAEFNEQYARPHR
jgi:membrane protein